MTGPVHRQGHGAVGIQMIAFRCGDVVLGGSDNQISALELRLGLERLAFVDGAVFASVGAGLITDLSAFAVEMVVARDVDIVFPIGNSYRSGLNHRLTTELAASGHESPGSIQFMLLAGKCGASEKKNR